MLEKKNKPGKQTKIKQLKYGKLAYQEYLLEGNKNTELSRLIFKSRGRNLDIKEHKNMRIVIVWDVKQEQKHELIDCPELKVENNEQERVLYS